MRKRLLASLSLLAAPAFAADLVVDVEVPRLEVAEYHHPYVALWLETPAQAHVADLSVWYDGKMTDKEGEKWLKDLRQWWRKSGRNLELPVDGVSGATRAVGTHTLTFTDSDPRLKALAAGDYVLVAEAAREVGGRELLRVPFAWPPREATESRAQGTSELGNVVVRTRP